MSIKKDKKIVASKTAMVGGKKVTTIYFADGTNVTSIRDPLWRK